MSKIRVKVSIKNDKIKDTYELNAILDNNRIKYKEDNGTTTIIDLDNKELIRENNELRMNYIFKINELTEGYILIKEYNKKIIVNIKTNKLEIDNNNIYIEYEIENNIFIYKLEEIK